jgi:hypothetical protein
MNDDIDQLSETFAAHEHLAPDSADVLVRAKAIARSYQRRRWAVRATGGAVLGAGLVAGGIALPGRLGHASTDQSVASVQPASGGDPSPSASPTSYTQDEEWAAYFAAGYDYTDAQQLAALWHDSSDIGTVKAAAGLKLLEGQSLPIPPSGTPETQAQKAQAEFFAAGYDSDDAVTLGKAWHETDLSQVKTQAGQALLDGKTLPIKPSGESLAQAQSSATRKLVLSKREAQKQALATSSGATVVVPTKQDAELQAYFAAGYDYNDGVTLSKLWHDADIFHVKVDAGQKLLDGQNLPIPPSGTPETPTNKAVDAFFNAGYTYDDAVSLAKTWHETDVFQVKAEAGKKLLDGQKLPIGP